MTEPDAPRGIAAELAAMPLDRTLSPATGWTRAHHERVADLSLLALRRWASPGKARFELPGPASVAGRASDGLEAFARSFLAAAFRLAGSSEDPHDHAGWYAAGLAAGADPSAVDRWPRLDEVRQARVEAAAVAIALHESRAWIWDRLEGGVQERLVDWLAGSLGADYGNSNWRWFQNVTQAFLRSVGGPVDEQEVADNLAFLDGCYLGDGWYTDGRPDGRAGNVDWYNPWVMQLFSLWYCRISGEAAAPGMLETSRSRMAALLPQLVRLFGPDGAPLYQGRSLVYRFATTGALWAGPVFDLDTVPAGEVRRVGSAALRWFVERDAYDEHDLLSLGWLGRHEAMRQPYSGPGSPYWSSLGFAGLVLGEDHPVWSEPEPVEDATPPTLAVEPVGWLVGPPTDGIVRVVNHGVDHSGAAPGPEDPQYCRFAYSTATAPVPVSPGAAAAPTPGAPDDLEPVPDNLVAVRDAAGRWSQRRPLTSTVVTGALAGSRHDVVLLDADGRLEPRPGEVLHTWSVLRGAVEVRVAVLRAEGADPLPLTLVLSGWATPTEDVHRAPAVSAVHPLLGDLRTGTSVHDAENPFGRRLVVPWAAAADVRPGAVHAVAVVLAEHEPALPAVSLDGTLLEIRWPDGVGDRIELDVVDGN
ncbi:DUF2264 domain-containing protein [Desertihabitans aurantiacus]|uniref:DUF2264 domain-containing protein n=1 Tax=Desertihabitans aurantiacus TaxID=2282477 RepID=UPI001300646A|nr:DUF2264 domain-containing protein [Desertihabitans aurantiacus]